MRTERSAPRAGREVRVPLTKYRSATLSATNQKSTMRPDMPRMSSHVLTEPS